MRLATVTAVRPLEPLAMSLTDAAARRALDQATLENGCLWYLRGSADPSSEYLREKEDIQRTMDQRHKFEVDETTDGAFAFVAQPGDAVVHSTLVVHVGSKFSIDEFGSKGIIAIHSLQRLIVPGSHVIT